MIYLLIVIIILFIMYIILGSFFYNLAINAKTNKAAILNADTNKTTEDGEENPFTPTKKMLSFLEKSDHEELYITNKGLKLHGTFINNNSKTTAIVIHGYNGNSLEMLHFAKKFYDMDYNIFLPDLRGHGKSMGTYIGMGYHDRLDIIKWIKYLNKKMPDKKIFLFGVSMGAATTMMTCGEKLPKNVCLAIEDCGYSSVYDEFKYQAKALFGLHAFPTVWAANFITKIKAHYSFRDASCIDQLRKCTIPMLFIHGTKDTFVPFFMLEKNYNAHNGPKEKLMIEGAIHGASSVKNSKKYWKTVEDFLKKYL